MTDIPDAKDSSPAESIADGTETKWKITFWTLCGMLFLALVGMGLSQAMESGAWEYWIFVVVVYAALGLWRSGRKAKQEGQPISRLIGRGLAHWSILLVFFAVLVLLQNREIIDRQSASDVGLLLLALTCCLAGVHFDHMLLVIGIVLTVMLIAMATLEQYSVILWIIMLLVTVAAAAYFFFKTRGEAAPEDSAE